MKQYKKMIIGGAICIGTFVSCADNETLSYAVTAPDSIAKTEYLKQYDVLKNYVDRSASPNFKLGAAISVDDYLSNGTVFGLTYTNFDEVTAGNAMKYGSCVGNDGSMKFDKVQKFVDKAKESNMTIYGHTLAWHSQQNNTFLKGLVAANRMLHVNIPEKKANPWDWEFYYDLDTPLTIGKTYVLSFTGKATSKYDMPFWPGDGSGTQYLPSFSLGVKEAVTSVEFKADLALNRMRFEVGTFQGDLYIDDISLTEKGSDVNLIDNPSFNSNDISHYTKPSWQSFTVEIIGNSAEGAPQTDEEKKDTLITLMDKWIGGMMTACGGYVTAWDVVNEPLAGTDADGDGYYDMQSAKRGTVSDEDAENNFYWQDYLGDLDYVRTTVKSARKHFAETGGEASKLKLFINDYNLESDWDDNKKVKSLINWIGKWEADGITKIDGIATQMHVSCFMNPAIQKSKEDHIVSMFKLMAATGKLVRISELDMGIVDVDGNPVNTADATMAQLQAQSDMYEFIVNAYLTNVPVAQQYGICQWCETDSPANSGWRAGEPVGLWTQGYNRKPAYAGFANGLAGKKIITAE